MFANTQMPGPFRSPAQKLGVVANAWNPSTLESEARVSGDGGQHRLHSEGQASLDCRVRPHPKKELVKK